MGIYSIFVSVFDYVMNNINQLVLFGGYGILSYFILIIITGIILTFIKRLV